MADFPHALTQAYIQLILLTFYVLLPYVINYVIRNNDAIIAKKQQTRWSQKKEHIKSGPGLRFVSVYMRTVRAQTGTKITRLGPATETKSDRSEFIFRPGSCKRKKEMYGGRYELIPVWVRPGLM